MKKTPEGRKRLEYADLKVQEYLEKQLVADHGEKGEKERPGITGRKDAGQVEGVQSEGSQAKTGGKKDKKIEVKMEEVGGESASTAAQQASRKRPAEDEADDAGRGDRADWRNFTESSSSNQAPGASQSASGSAAVEAVDSQGGDHVISNTVTPASVPTGGTKRTQEEHASMEYDGAEVEAKTQRISSICLAVASDDITGEVDAASYDEELKEMAAQYKAALEAGQCFVHVRAKRSSNKDLRMLSRLTDSKGFRKVNLHGSDFESVVTNSAYVAALLEEAQCETRENVEIALEKEIKGKNWKQEAVEFEQHMLEEDEVRVKWQTGKFEDEELQCSNCGDRNAWDCMHPCCQEECKKHLNALQSFPLAAWDDISAAPLDPEMVKAARQLEIRYAEQKPVWEKIPRAVAKQKGWKVVKSRWIDINKGDDKTPNYRSRMVGKEFNDSVLEGLFAATPPLEALRLLLSHAASFCPTSGIYAGGSGGTMTHCRSLLIADVSRAFFEAPAKRDLCVELPEEALATGETTFDTVGKLKASLYGTRDASMNWQEEVAKCMLRWGFKVGRYNPCMYHSPERGMLCLVHGDDFVCVGEAEDLQWLEKRLKERFEIKSKTMGLKDGESREERILNRMIRVSEHGWEYEADQRHADLIIRETGAEKLSPLSHPGGDKKTIEEEEKSEELQGQEATRFRAVAARANYLAADRPDIQYSVKEVCRRMAKPVKSDWNKLVRLARYLKGSPRLVWK